MRADAGEWVRADLAEWLFEADMDVVERLSGALYDVRGGTAYRRPGVDVLEAARIVVLLGGTRIDENYYTTDNVNEDATPLFDLPENFGEQ